MAYLPYRQKTKRRHSRRAKARRMIARQKSRARRRGVAGWHVRPPRVFGPVIRKRSVLFSTARPSVSNAYKLKALEGDDDDDWDSAYSLGDDYDDLDDGLAGIFGFIKKVVTAPVNLVKKAVPIVGRVTGIIPERPQIVIREQAPAPVPTPPPTLSAGFGGVSPALLIGGAALALALLKR